MNIIKPEDIDKIPETVEINLGAHAFGERFKGQGLYEPPEVTRIKQFKDSFPELAEHMGKHIVAVRPTTPEMCRQNIEVNSEIERQFGEGSRHRDIALAIIKKSNDYLDSLIKNPDRLDLSTKATKNHEEIHRALNIRTGGEVIPIDIREVPEERLSASEFRECQDLSDAHEEALVELFVLKNLKNLDRGFAEGYLAEFYGMFMVFYLSQKEINGPERLYSIVQSIRENQLHKQPKPAVTLVSRLLLLTHDPNILIKIKSGEVDYESLLDSVLGGLKSIAEDPEGFIDRISSKNKGIEFDQAYQHQKSELRKAYNRVFY